MKRSVPGRQFHSGEKRGCVVGKTKRAKGTRWMVMVDGAGLPLGDHLHSGFLSEVQLVEATLASIRVGWRHRPGRPRKKPECIIADRGYESYPMRKQLARRGIELIAPHRKNRRKPATLDGRALRRYKRRWTVEHTFAWFGNFRRLVVRDDARRPSVERSGKLRAS
jgi:transposase